MILLIDKEMISCSMGVTREYYGDNKKEICKLCIRSKSIKINFCPGYTPFKPCIQLIVKRLEKGKFI